jgi:hypothetical protein
MWKARFQSNPPLVHLINDAFIAQQQYKPRNRVPWTIIGISYVACMILLLIIRAVLAAENKRRDAAPKIDDPYDNVYVERLSSGGIMEKVKVDKVCTFSARHLHL